MNKIYQCLELLYHNILPFKELNEYEFPKKMMSLMSEIRYPKSISDQDIIELVLCMNDMPKQYYTERQFGEFNITVFHHENFSIQIYIMNEIDTEIHDHTFVGAFQVLLGENIHTEYEFKEEQQIAKDVIEGELKIKKISNLAQFDILPLNKGSIHQISRTKSKNITLMVMKNIKTSNALYLPPKLKIHYPDIPALIRRKIFALEYCFVNQTLSEDVFDKFYSILEDKFLLSLAVRLQGYGLNLDFTKLFHYKLLTKLKDKNLENYFSQYTGYLVKIKAKALTYKKI